MTLGNKAFTLVELLVTVAIVGILASLAVSNFQSYKQQVNDTIALSALKSAMTSAEAYMHDNPELYNPNVPNTIYGGVSFNYPSDGSAPYLSNFPSGLPGYTHTKGVSLHVSFRKLTSVGFYDGVIDRGGLMSYTVYASHENGSPVDEYRTREGGPRKSYCVSSVNPEGIKKMNSFYGTNCG